MLTEVKIPDAIFKELKHCCSGYTMFRNGQNLEPGYKPDYVLAAGNSYIILECDNSSSRKTFVGAMIKAAHFLRDDKQGILVLVLVNKQNVNYVVIARHLKKYLNWIGSKTNLKDIYVLSSTNYWRNGKVLTVLGKKFLALAQKV